jgi:hypothetical protein
LANDAAELEPSMIVRLEGEGALSSSLPAPWSGLIVRGDWRDKGGD